MPMPKQDVIHGRLQRVAKAVSKKLSNDCEVESELDDDQRDSFQGSWADLGATRDGIRIIIFAGQYFRSSNGTRSLQFWAGLEAEPKHEKLLKRFLSRQFPFETIRAKDYCDPEALWLATEEKKRWFRPHLDLSEKRNYSWFGRFFSGEFSDKRLEREVSTFLLELIETEKRTGQLS
jgi:hypothetical protein